RAAWCGPIGVQYMHIDDVAARRWIEARLEDGVAGSSAPPPGERIRILARITEAAAFEEFMHRKYLGAKRVSLDGAETLVTILDIAVDAAAQSGADEVVMGMAHRGRLNILANVIGKPLTEIFREFADADGGEEGAAGDVKYHLGHGGDIE